MGAWESSNSNAMGIYLTTNGLQKLQQIGTMDDDVHINGWQQYPTKYGT